MGSQDIPSTSSAAGPFPSTVWSDVRGLQDPVRVRESLERLAQTYWRPLYGYVRAAGGRSRADAEEITQAFFVHLLEGERLIRLAPSITSFRAYLKTSLRHFIVNEARESAALKRGGDRPRLPFEKVEAWIPVAEADPGTAFDREWARSVMDAALEKLRRSLEGEGKDAYWKAFQLYSSGASYQDIAAGIGTDESHVRNHLTRVRGLLREILKDLIRDYVDSGGEAEEEMAYFIGLWRL